MCAKERSNAPHKKQQFHFDDPQSSAPVMHHHNLWCTWIFSSGLSFYSVSCISGTIFDPSKWNHLPRLEADHSSSPPKKIRTNCVWIFILKVVFFGPSGGCRFSVMLKGVGLYYQDVYCSCGLATGGAGQGGGKFMGKTWPNLMWCDSRTPKR